MWCWFSYVGWKGGVWMVVCNVKVIFLLVFFFIYFGLELSFNLLLVDVYLLLLEVLFGDKYYYVVCLELFGWMFFGFGFLLVIVFFVFV